MKALIRLVLGVFLMTYCNTTHAQKDSYLLKLTSGNYALSDNLTTFQLSDLGKESKYNGKYYAYIRFDKIPTEKEKSVLFNQGVELMGYLPDNVYQAAIKSSADISGLSSYGISGIHKILPAYKMNEALSYQNFPEHALRGNNVKLNLLVYSNLKLDNLLSKIESIGANVESTYTYSNKLTIEIDKSKFMEVAKLPFVSYLEAIDPEPVKENLVGRTNHRSNVISNTTTNPVPYNGEGVWVALGDDGIVGDHIDYTGRTEQSNVSSDNGNHGDHIAGTIMGAGNLDPTTRGMAWGSELIVYSVWDAVNNSPTSYVSPGIVATSTSYGNGCNAGYNAFAQTADQQIRQMPNLIHVFSAGNSGTSDCGYGAGSGWGNITGGIKAGKNVIAVGNLTSTDNISNSSSRGPAHDGRIKPDVCAVGSSVYSTNGGNIYNTSSGTSMAAPGVSGTYAQLVHAFRENNGGQTPESALIKSTLMNTADDLGNVGPDFTYGWGRINARRAADLLLENRYMSSTISQGDNNTHTITVPAGTDQIKVMVYWADYEASTNASTALVNNIDFVLEDAGGTDHFPWILDPTPNSTNLSQPATTGVDDLNNMEQVVIDAPSAGNYTVKLAGTSIPQGPQKYYVVYEFLQDDITLTYPIGGEGFVPNESELIRWDALSDAGTYLLEYTIDNGANWNTITPSLSGARRYYDWQIPTSVTGNAKVRITRGASSAESDSTFSIIGVPSNLEIEYTCPDSFGLSWIGVNGATAYEVSVLGSKYMDSVTTVTSTSANITGYDPNDELWVSVKALTNDAIGRRAIAIQKLAGVFNCTLNDDISLEQISEPGNILTGCSNQDSSNVTVVLRNNGLTPYSTFELAYSYNTGVTVQQTFNKQLIPGDTVHVTFNTAVSVTSTGTTSLDVWLSNHSDDFSANDSLSQSIILLGTSASQNFPYAENFDSFSTCPTNSNCEAGQCPLSNDWTNITNGTGDDIDWRTDAFGTPSNNTGPTGDHTGNGNYLYLEASGDCIFQEAIAISPCIDLSGASAPEFSFWYNMFGFSMGELHVDVLVDGVWHLDIVAPLIGNQSTQWEQAMANFSPYVGKIINVRFRGITGEDYASDMAIDDILIEEATQAPIADFDASSINACQNIPVTLTDLSQNSPNSWIWTISPATYSFVNGTSASSQNPEVIFSQEDEYDIQLMVSNSNGADSVLKSNHIEVGAIQAGMLTEDFQTATVLTDDWTVVNGDASYTWELSGLITGADGSTTTAAMLDFYNYTFIGQEDYLESSLIDLSLVNNGTLTFDMAYAQKTSVDADELRVEVSYDCGQTWLPTGYTKEGGILATVAPSPSSWVPNDETDWRNEQIDLTPYYGLQVKFRWVSVNGFGNALFIDNINLMNNSTTVAGINVAKEVCVGESVTISDASQGSNLTYDWNFGTDASIGAANTVGPHVVSYSSAGTKTISLNVTGSNGNDNTIITIDVVDQPVADFSWNYDYNTNEMTFTNNSSNIGDLSWDFGDGNSSTDDSPVHPYALGNSYVVTLVNRNVCGADTFSTLINSWPLGVDDAALNSSISVYPNPANDRANIYIDSDKSETLSIEILDSKASVVYSLQKDISSGKNVVELELNQLNRGVYFIHLKGQEINGVKRLVVQ